jgi:hypothetical protein
MIFQRVSGHDVELEHFLAGLLRQKESSPQEKQRRGRQFSSLDGGNHTKEKLSIERQALRQIKMRR